MLLSWEYCLIYSRCDLPLQKIFYMECMALTGFAVLLVIDCNALAVQSLDQSLLRLIVSPF